MKIFVLLSRVPYPLEKGDKLRAYEQLKILSAQYQIHLCCLHSKKSVSDEISIQLQQICSQFSIVKLNWFNRFVSLILGFFKNQPIQVSYFYQKKAYQKVQKQIQAFQPDHIYCQLIRTTEYVKANFEVPKTLDYMDALSKGMLRRFESNSTLAKAIFKYEYRRLRKYEERIFDFFEFSCIISKPDCLWINHAKKNQILIVPNGVNDQNYEGYKGIPKDYDLVFTGNMQYAPNIDAAIYLVEQIMPLVWEQNPSILVLISGASPTKKILSLSAKNVTVTGWVDDILHSYARSKIFIAPMRLGSGLQNKLLEAMSMKTPCITTSIANLSLNATHQKNILVADDAQSLANDIIELLNNRELADLIAENGHKFVEENYNWKASTNILNQAFRAKIK